MSRLGCESKLLWSFRLRLRRRRVASWSCSRCRARGSSSAGVPVPVGAPSTAPRSAFAAWGCGQRSGARGSPFPVPRGACSQQARDGRVWAWRGTRWHPQLCRERGRERALLLSEQLSIVSWHRGRLSVASMGGSGGFGFPAWWERGRRRERCGERCGGRWQRVAW